MRLRKRAAEFAIPDLCLEGMTQRLPVECDAGAVRIQTLGVKHGAALFGFSAPRRVYDFPILLFEGSDVRIKQNFKNDLGWPAESGALGCYDDRPIDEYRVCNHEVDQLVIRPLWIV